jgi:DNA-directed RNA polymerase subunit RPC12/RpoP
MTPTSNVRVDKNGWVRCPVCGAKTRLKVRSETTFANLPLFCPKCHHESMANLPSSRIKNS